MRTGNPLRDLIKAGKPTIGTHVLCIWPGFAEVIGNSGTMDYIEFCGEYGPFDLLSLENFARAVDLFPHMGAMMKIDQEPRTFLAARATGAGIQNLLFADCRGLEDAKTAVRSARPDTPQAGGLSGASMKRDAGYGYAKLEHSVRGLEQGVVALMIEKKGALEQLEEILAIPGLDMVQYGPGDYSMSMGIPGQYGSEIIKKAEKRVIQTAIKMGVRPRVEIDSWEEAKPYVDMGVKDFCIGWDTTTVLSYCKNQGSKLANLLGR